MGSPGLGRELPMWVPGWYLNQKHRTRRCDASERIQSGLTEPAGGWAARAQITSGPGGGNAPTPEGRGLGEAGSLSRPAGTGSLSLVRTGEPSPRDRAEGAPAARPGVGGSNLRVERGHEAPRSESEGASPRQGPDGKPNRPGDGDTVPGDGGTNLRGRRVGDQALTYS